VRPGGGQVPETKSRPASDELVLSLAEAGERMNATERQVRRWIDKGVLGYVRLPHGRHVRPSQIEAFLAAQEIAPLNPPKRGRR